MGVMHPCHYPGCMKKFDRKYNLKCHLRIHSNEKPYRCHHENCTRSFRWKSSLNHHLMSLDHTPAAVRRARKARAQRRRIARNSPQTFLPQPPIDHQHPVFDLPALSPVSSVATYSHSPSPQQRTLPDITHNTPSHHFKLDHTLNPSADVSNITPSSISPPSLTVHHDVQLFNRNHIQHHQSTDPNQNTNQAHLYSHAPPQYRPPPTQVMRCAPRLHHPQQQNLFTKTQQHNTIMAQLQDPLAMHVKPLQNPLIPDPPVKTEIRSFAEDSSQPRTSSEAETSIHTPTDDTISLVTPTKKSEPVDFNSATKAPMAPPLVSIFEEFSPVSLMPFSSSLDSLFPANVDSSGMKSF